MNASTKRIYDQVFQHPMTHNLEWRDVRSLFETLGEVEAEHNGNQKVTIKGQSLMFHSPSNSDTLTSDQVSQVRHLLRRSETVVQTAHMHLLMVIDHSETRVFRTDLKEAEPETVTPQDTLGHQRHVHSAHDYSDHIEKPNHSAYFEAISKSLEGAEQILIFGSGSGSSSMMDLFAVWLREHHPALSDIVVSCMVVDESHLTEGQLLAKAREVYAEENPSS
jgi:hypothetical protein